MINIFNYFSKISFKKSKPEFTSFYDFERAMNDSWILREKEMHKNPIPNLRTSHIPQLLIEDIFSNIYDIDKSELCCLNIIDGNLNQSITDIDQIWNYDILKPYKDIGSCGPSHKFYTLLYRSDGLDSKADKSRFNSDGAIMLHTSAIKSEDKNCNYIDLSICIPTFFNLKGRYKREDVLPSNYMNFCIAYDFDRTTNARAEFEYYNESVSSGNYNDKGHLKKEEWTLLNSIKPDIANEFYWGKKAFCEKRYLDAILYLKNIYSGLKNKWYKKGLSSEEMTMLTECSFLIGFVYNDMKMYDKAYNYLELAGRANSKDYKYKKEFVNCLVNSKNLLSIIYLDDYLQDMKNINENKRTSEDLNFFYFLLRRKAFVLIEMDQFDDAEYILSKILEKDPYNEVVLNELAYIQKKRRSNDVENLKEKDF